MSAQDSHLPSHSVTPEPEHGAELLAAFMEFPEPLALLDSQGHVDLANTSFMEQFGVAGVHDAWLQHLNAQVEHNWKTVSLPSLKNGGSQVSARALRTAHHTVVLIDHAGNTRRDREVEQLRQQLAEVARLATTDYLTSAWNRTHFHQVIELEMVRSLNQAQPVSLILFDVDHFKGVNDRFGHALGDVVLRELALLARRNLRASDALFRWGGDEFVVLVAAGYRGAERLADKLRKAVASHSFEEVGTVTISLGVAEHELNEPVHEWFERLDAALYRAKNAGRNGVGVDRRGASDVWASVGHGHLLHLRWEEGYESGDLTIDDQHRELFRLANKLIAASMRAAPNTRVVNDALDDLIVHIREHFRDEEALLERLRYPQLEEHRRAHNALLCRALKMQEMLPTGHVTVGAIVEFLADDVVARHLLSVDKAFFPLFDETAAHSAGNPREG